MARDAAYWTARTIKQPWEQMRKDNATNLLAQEKQIVLQREIAKEHQATGEKINEVYQSIANLEMDAKSKKVLLEKFKNDVQGEAFSQIRKVGGDSRVWLRGGGEIWLGQKSNEIPMWQEYEDGKMNALAMEMYNKARMRGDLIKPVVTGELDEHDNPIVKDFDDVLEEFQDLDNMDRVTLPYAGSISKGEVRQMLSYFGSQPKPGYEASVSRQPISESDIADWLVSFGAADAAQAQYLAKDIYDSGQKIGGVTFTWGGGDVNYGKSNEQQNLENQLYSPYITSTVGLTIGKQINVPNYGSVIGPVNWDGSSISIANDYKGFWAPGTKTFAGATITRAGGDIETIPFAIKQPMHDNQTYADLIRGSYLATDAAIAESGFPQNFNINVPAMISTLGTGGSLHVLIDDTKSLSEPKYRAVNISEIDATSLEYLYSFTDPNSEELRDADYSTEGYDEVKDMFGGTETSYMPTLYNFAGISVFPALVGEGNVELLNVPGENQLYMKMRVRMTEDKYEALDAGLQTSLGFYKANDFAGKWADDQYIGEIMLPISPSASAAVYSAKAQNIPLDQYKYPGFGLKPPVPAGQAETDTITNQIINMPLIEETVDTSEIVAPVDTSETVTPAPIVEEKEELYGDIRFPDLGKHHFKNRKGYVSPDEKKLMTEGGFTYDKKLFLWEREGEDGYEYVHRKNLEAWLEYLRQ